MSVRIKTVSLSPLKNVKIFVNGNERKNYNENKQDFEISLSDLDIKDDGVYELKVRSTNEKDKTGESAIKFGLNKPWDYTVPTSAPAPTNTPTQPPSPTDKP